MLAREATIRLYRDNNPHIVFHPAGVMERIEANPGSFYQDNLMMEALLMHCAQHTNTEKLLAIGTLVLA